MDPFRYLLCAVLSLFHAVHALWLKKRDGCRPSKMPRTTCSEVESPGRRLKRQEARVSGLTTHCRRDPRNAERTGRTVRDLSCMELASRRSDRIPGFSPLAGSRNSLAFAPVSRFLEDGLSRPAVPEALGQQTVLTVSSTSAGQASTNLHGNPGDYCDLRQRVCFCVEFSEYCAEALVWEAAFTVDFVIFSELLPTRDHVSLLFGIQQSGPSWPSEL